MANAYSPRQLAHGAAFFTSLFFHLRRPLGVEAARASLSQRLANRTHRFLARFRRDFFGNGDNPYHAMLRHAGCELGDVEQIVRKDGVEGALDILFRAGVYLTIDEFKGRVPIRRGSLQIAAPAEAFRSRGAAHHVSASSGGSRGAGTPVLIDLRFVRDCAADAMLYLEAWNGLEWVKATWEVPGAGARFRITKYAAFSPPPERWFSQVDPDDPTLPPILRLNTRAMLLTGRLAGVPLPAPQYAPPEDPRPVARWLCEVLAAGRVPHLFTFPSSAVALCRTVLRDGIDIAGARFTLAGEPTTPARLATVASAGVSALPRYGSIENGAIGYGCHAPVDADDVHLLADQHAVIQVGPAAPAGLPPDALFLTSLNPRSPFAFLNASMGDRATIESRACGCPLERLGWSTHLRGIRSYEKLTGAAVTFLGGDIVHILETVLPDRFGGTSIDYQLCEDEDAEGYPVLSLLVNPSLGALDDLAILKVFLDALAAASPSHRLMERMLHQSRSLRVERRPPLSTQAGKVLHLHLSRSGRSGHER
jgi:hypothetical protein